VAIKVAPVQGWGVYWNAAHPDQPFTPVIVDLAAPGGTTAGSQAGAGSHAGTSAPSQMTAPAAGSSGSAPSPSVGVQSEGSHGPADASLAETSALSSLNQSHGDDGWFVVPSAGNDGQGGFDVAAGDISADWFIV